MSEHCSARGATTNFLTTAKLVYTWGAGITAAAGTRLSLLLILNNDFYLSLITVADTYSPDTVIHRYYLPALRDGNLRACCLPWM
jgi:hypothetical protein